MSMTFFAPVPEPGVTVPLALVFLGLVTATRRRQKQAAAAEESAGPQPGI
jgi:hypothetical protein